MTREEALKIVRENYPHFGTSEPWLDLEKALATLIPELRESEDERIRKEIIDFIQWAEDRGMTRHDYHQAKRPAVWIAYLEKQKECVVDNNKTSAEEDERIRARLIEYFKGFLEGYEDCYKDGGCVKWEGLDVKSILAWLERQKEPADSFTDGIIEVRSFQRGMEEGRRLEKQEEQKHPNGCFTCDEYKKGYEEGRRNGFTAGYNKAMKEVEQKEQKPVEYLSKDKVYAIMSKLTKLSTSSLIPFNSPEYKKINEITSDVRSLLDYPIEQKPAEWSEDDKHNLNSAINLVHATTDGAWGSCIGDGIEKWLNSLPERFNLPSKQEWSEEDENKIESIKGLITMGKFVDTNTIKTIWKLLDSLRPQPKVEWSEEDEKILKGIIGLIDHNQHYDVSNKDMLAWLKSLRPVSKESLQPQWKPNKEQMKALKKVACNLVGTGTETDVYLIQLFEQLKKL